MTTRAKRAKQPEPVVANDSRINEVAMLVCLRQSIWRAVRTDDEVTQEVSERHGNKRDMGVYKKFLVDPAILRPGYKILGDARAEHNRLTLPWQDDGYRILSNAGYLRYTKAMQSYRDAYSKWVREEFVPAYPQHKKAAKAALNGLFKEEDYPSEAAIEGKFGCVVSIWPMPYAEDFRVKLSDAETARVKSEMQGDIDRVVKDAIKDVWTRLQGVVGNMVERLKAYNVTEAGKVEHPFRDTLVTNIVEIVDLVPILNITDDPNLTQFSRRIKDELTAYNPEVLRDDAAKRKDVARRAEEILGKMGAFIQ